MKKLIFTFFCITFLNSFTFSRNKVETLDLMGEKYTVTRVFPDEIIGKYEYKGEGPPRIRLNKDGSGYFQPHQTSPITIKFWIDCDEEGNWRKQEGGTGRYQYTLVIQYLDGNNGNYIAGSFDLMGVLIQPDMGKVSILGERFKSL